jgi:hypothetical protein
MIMASIGSTTPTNFKNQSNFLPPPTTESFIRVGTGSFGLPTSVSNSDALSALFNNQSGLDQLMNKPTGLDKLLSQGGNRSDTANLTIVGQGQALARADAELQQQGVAKVAGDDIPQLVAIAPRQASKQQNINEIDQKIAKLKPGQTLDKATAIRLARLEGIDPTKPMVIGGGGDGYGTDITGQFAKQKGWNWSNHFQGSKVNHYVEITKALGKPTAIIGHSYGGGEALKAAQYTHGREFKVDFIATIDPVTRGIDTKSIADSLGKPFSREQWVSIEATAYKTNPDIGDNIAWVGGRMPSDQQRTANIYADVNTHHGYFNTMMTTPIQSAGGKTVVDLVNAVYSKKASGT